MKSLSSRVQKLVTFSPQLYFNAQARAKQLGVPLAEYLRHLVMKDIEEEIANLPMVDEEINKKIGQSLKEITEGNYVEIDPSNEEELKKFIGLK